MSLGSQSLFSAPLPWASAASCFRLSATARLGLCPRLPGALCADLHRVLATSATAERTQPLATSFGQLSLGQDLLSALDQQNLLSPTEIQSSAIPAILEGGDVLLASHTGSGKTLAYLLPLVKHLKEQETKGASTRPKRPRALVLGPTRELTDQILTVAKGLSHYAKFRSTCLNGGRQMSQQVEALAMPQDIVIATPQRIASHAEKGNLFYGDVQVVVLDEADTMFDEGFGPEVRAVLKPLRAKADPARCILVVATLSTAVRRLLHDEFPRLRYVETSTLHKAIPNARHAFLPIAGTDNKLEHLAHLLAGDQAKGRRTMVFCNTLDSCRAAEHFLVEQDLATVCYHGDIPLDQRKTALHRFAGADVSDARRPALVCTDLAARGLDIPGSVDHVINFDFPLNPLDFLHRTGRTARAGASGRITSLVTKRDRTLAQRIEKALASGQSIDQLSGAPARPTAKPETIARRSAEHAAGKAARKGTRGASRGKLPDAPAYSSSRPAGPGKPFGSSRPAGPGKAFGSSRPAEPGKPFGGSRSGNAFSERGSVGSSRGGPGSAARGRGGASRGGGGSSSRGGARTRSSEGHNRITWQQQAGRVAPAKTTSRYQGDQESARRKRFAPRFASFK